MAIPLWVRQKRAARSREMAAAIQSSALFSNPVTVVASSRTDRSNESPSLEALTLRDAGLLTIDDEPSSRPSPPPSSPDPKPPHIRTIRRTTLELIHESTLATVARLTPKDIAATRDWQPFEDPEHQRRGWIVPVGNRELIELTSVEGADTATAQVQFTWYWKPNEVGWQFDINERSRKQNPSWKRKSHPDLSSGYPFKGTAEIGRIGNRWEVKSIKWDLEMRDRLF